MYRLMIVEDEAVIREGLIEQIPWQRYGFQVIGEAGNGKDAMELIPWVRPDIILTDIVMPVMGGIDLIAWAKEHFPGIKLVVLSGYHEFEYARKCIEYQALGYLLKPTDTQEIEAMFRRAKEELDGTANAVKATHRNLLKDIVTGKIGEEAASRLQTDEWADLEHFVVMRIETANSADAELWKTSEKWKIEHNKDNIYILDLLDEEEHAFSLLLGSRIRLSKQACVRIAQQIKASLRRLLPPDAAAPAIAIGIGQPRARLAQVGVSRKEAQLAGAAKFFHGADAVIHIADCARDTAGARSAVVAEMDARITDMIGGLLASDAALLERALAGYFDLLAGRRVDDKEMIYMKTVEWMIRLSVQLAEKAISLKQIYDRNFHLEIRKIVDRGTLDELAAWMRAVCGAAAAFLAARETDRNNDPVIERAKAYIHEHYDRKLSLEAICEHLFMSPSHFCLLFKQRTGQTFVGYLTQVRLSKAKELLKRADVKVYEVAVAVGYDDFRHFSKLFKKSEGLNPKEWAAERQKQETGGSGR
ncbi:MAG: response regulator [Paenibacillaceae bacterium]|nr:response regulator [Paenibacillaceae bacterium]